MQRTSDKILFGRTDLSSVYYQTLDLFFYIRPSKIYHTKKTDGVYTLTICNLWRIVCDESSTKTFEFSIESNTWQETLTSKTWPNMHLLPISRCSIDIWKIFISQSVDKILDVVGFNTLPNYHHEIDWNKNKYDIKPEMSKYTMRSILLKTIYRKLNKSMMESAIKGLTKEIFSNLIKKPVLSAMQACDYDYVTLTRYIAYARHENGLLKVANEHRNLLPLLPRINSEYWSHNDLFSKKFWVIGINKKPIAISKKFNSTFEKNYRFKGFISDAGFKFLRNAQLSVVKKWVIDGNKNVITLENLAKANITDKIPAIAWSALVKYNYRLNDLGINTQVQRLYRLFAKHCAQIWTINGFSTLRTWLKMDMLGQVIDWLVDEGFLNNQPSKNATFESLCRLSNIWHERIHQSCYDQTHHATWSSLINKTEINHIVFRAITSSKELYLEGKNQHHCVYTFRNLCISGLCQIFSVLEPDGTKSTISLFLENDCWVLGEHKGVCNSTVSKTAEQAGLKLIEYYSSITIDDVQKKSYRFNNNIYDDNLLNSIIKPRLKPLNLPCINRRNYMFDAVSFHDTEIPTIE